MPAQSKDQQDMISHKEVSLNLGPSLASPCPIRPSGPIDSPEARRSPIASSLRPSKHMPSKPFQQVCSIAQLNLPISDAISNSPFPKSSYDNPVSTCNSLDEEDL